MAATNVRARDHRKEHGVSVAGGFGATAARQTPESLLRRAVLAHLLWEDVAYQKGATVAKEIRKLVPQIDPALVARIAVEARTEQHLRHVPLYLAVRCARTVSHRRVLATLLPQIILRADELTEFVSLYWNGKRRPLSAGIKKGLATAFQRFTAYDLAKYNRETGVKLRDVLFLCHAKPKDEGQAATWKQLIAGTLPAPDTWEVALSRGADKTATWTRLITERKIGGLAFLRNLRNMQEAGVERAVIREGFATLRDARLLPLNFLAAAKHAPDFQPEIEDAMLRALALLPKLRGETVLVVDVSGSMGAGLSGRSEMSRLDAAAAMAVVAREMCEHVEIWATAGNDGTRVHATAKLPAHRGFALASSILGVAGRLGGGGIFTRQCLEHIKAHTPHATDRTIVFSDSQDCDHPDSRVPVPFSARNYIVDISANTRGIAYEGVWNAEISGWSERFLTFIHELEVAPRHSLQPQ